MTLPSKGLRKILVDDMRYAWSATGNDGRIGLTIAPLEGDGQILRTSFGYHSKLIRKIVKSDGSSIENYRQQFVITPFIVRQVIEYGLDNGWHPSKKGKQIYIENMDEKIDLNI
jgi:hypothetical protein